MRKVGTGQKLGTGLSYSIDLGTGSTHPELTDAELTHQELNNLFSNRGP